MTGDASSCREGFVEDGVYPSTSRHRASCPFHDGARDLEARMQQRSGAGQGVFVCFVSGPEVQQMLLACVGFYFLCRTSTQFTRLEFRV